MPYIFSALTCDNEYADYTKSGQGDKQIIRRTVKIAGGHGLMNKNFVTPQGAVVTEVTDEELEFLQTVNMFKEHVANGFITFDKKKGDADKVISDMSTRDKSAQIVPSDYEPGGMMDVVPKGKK